MNPTPIITDLLRQRDSESVFDHSLRRDAGLKRLEEERSLLIVVLERMLDHERDMLKLLKLFAPSDAEENENAELEARIRTMESILTRTQQPFP